MRKSIYDMKLKGYYQIVNYKSGRRMVSKNKNNISVDDIFTENTIDGIQNDEKSINKIRRKIKNNKELEITITEISYCKFISMSNDIY